MRKEAEALLGVPHDRNEEALPPIRSLQSAIGDPGRGVAVFETHCAQCHDAEQSVAVFGPSLAEIGAKLSKHALFVAILHPSAGISFGYEGLTLTLKDSSRATGYVADESGEA